MPGQDETREEFIPVDRNAGGRTLSRPLKDEYDRTLLPSGTLLDDAVIGRLGEIGVPGAWVVKTGGRDGRVLTLEQVFRDRLDDPLMAAIRAAAKEIISKGAGA